MAAATGPLECTGRRTIFGPPPLPPINFVYDHLLVSKIIIIFSIVLGLGQVKTISGPRAAARMPSTAARTGQGAERCGQDRLGGRGLRPHDQCVTKDKPCTKLIGAGVYKSFSRKLPKTYVRTIVPQTIKFNYQSPLKQTHVPRFQNIPVCVNVINSRHLSRCDDFNLCILLQF